MGETHDVRWPGSHESSLLYFERDWSECSAAAGPVPLTHVWFGNVPTSHSLYLQNHVQRKCFPAFLL